MPERFVELNHALAGSLPTPKDTETGEPMKWDLRPGQLIFLKENTDRKQLEALQWNSSSH